MSYIGIDKATPKEWDDVMQSYYSVPTNQPLSSQVMYNRADNKYTKQIRGVKLDVYDVLDAWNVTNPALQHLIKKALQAGNRGHKDLMTDLQDIIDSAIRAKQLEEDKPHGTKH